MSLQGCQNLSTGGLSSTYYAPGPVSMAWDLWHGNGYHTAPAPRPHYSQACVLAEATVRDWCGPGYARATDVFIPTLWFPLCCTHCHL